MPEKRPRQQRLDKNFRQRCRNALTLSIIEFRQHLKTGLRDLPLTEGQRTSLLNLFATSPPPTDVRFWESLLLAEEAEKQDPQTTSAVNWIQEYFRTGFVACYGEHVPSEWMQMACSILVIVDDIKRIAEGALREKNLLTAENYTVIYRTDWQKFSSTVRAIEQKMPPAMRRVLSRKKKSPFLGFDATLSALQEGDPDPFFMNLRWRPELLMDADIFSLTVGTWSKQKHLGSVEGKKAKKWLARVGVELAWVGKGNVEHITDEEREAIATSCEKWLPICQGLNTKFKELWKLSKYATSALFKKEAQGGLAEKFNIDVADVKAIETYLQAASHNARKSTPTSAMLRIVARKHFPQGDASRHTKTIEKIYQERR